MKQGKGKGGRSVPTYNRGYINKGTAPLAMGQGCICKRTDPPDREGQAGKQGENRRGEAGQRHEPVGHELSSGITGPCVFVFGSEIHVTNPLPKGSSVSVGGGGRLGWLSTVQLNFSADHGELQGGVRGFTNRLSGEPVMARFHLPTRPRQCPAVDLSVVP